MGTSAKIPFNHKNPDMEAVRQIIFERLRNDSNWRQLDQSGDGYAPYVEYAGQTELDWRDGRQAFVVLALEVFWQSVIEGILAPGFDYNNSNLPWFHVTAYGRQVIASTEPQPYDPTAYLKQLHERVANPDRTVMAYLAESLETLRKGNLVASPVMLGIAAERVFLLLCESLEAALGNAGDKATFTKLLGRFPVKPKLDWVHNKIQQIQKQAPTGFPENATIMIVAIYDLMRGQRNDLGHPRELPPRVKREDAFINLQIFPRYYEIAEETRNFVRSNLV
jgi:hypothetical protein